MLLTVFIDTWYIHKHTTYITHFDNHLCGGFEREGRVTQARLDLLLQLPHLSLYHFRISVGLLSERERGREREGECLRERGREREGERERGREREREREGECLRETVLKKETEREHR